MELTSWCSVRVPPVLPCCPFQPFCLAHPHSPGTPCQSIEPLSSRDLQLLYLAGTQASFITFSLLHFSLRPDAAFAHRSPFSQLTCIPLGLSLTMWTPSPLPNSLLPLSGLSSSPSSFFCDSLPNCRTTVY